MFPWAAIRAIVLAAGASTRMGAPKALLPDRAGRLFITRVLHTLHAAGITDVTVVTGALHDSIVRAVAADAPPGAVTRFARNPDPSRGQLSSLLAGLDAAAAPGVDAVLVTPVDVPLVAPRTVRAVVDAFVQRGAPIVRPATGSRHGHPVLFARRLFDELRHADPSRGAKAVVHAHASEAIDLQVDDEGALVDVDTPEEYEKTFGARQSAPGTRASGVGRRP